MGLGRAECVGFTHREGVIDDDKRKVTFASNVIRFKDVTEAQLNVLLMMLLSICT